MKKLGFIIILALAALTWSSCKQDEGKKTAAEAFIEFDTTRHDYGEIPFNGDGEVEFVFTNSGTGPLLVTHVKSTCGCTIPEWSEEPVKSSARGKILVSYDTHRVGAFTKSIYVYSNAANGAQKLMITGKVNRASIE